MKIFLAAFLISLLFLGARFASVGMSDSQMWTDQARYVVTHDQAQYDFLRAYGHPGGPIILGTIAFHSLFVFLALFMSLFIAATCMLCYKMSKDHFWWVAVLGVLSLHPLYSPSTTPPSAVVAVLIAFLFILTAYVVKSDSSRPFLIAWSITAGLAIATRFDIGALSVAFFALPLLQPIGIKKVGYLMLGTVAAFFIFNPFMWHMPAQHVSDLFSKIFMHYADFEQVPLSFNSVLSFSFLSLISMLLAVLFLAKRWAFLIPASLLHSAIALTAICYFVFLTSHFQTKRYFLPLLFMWEMLLPLFLLTLMHDRRAKLLIVMILLVFPAWSLISWII